MARFTIKTRTVGPLTFWCDDRSGYVHLESEGRSGTLGRQICAGGDFYGETLKAAPAQLPEVARNWWRQRRAWKRV